MKLLTGILGTLLISGSAMASGIKVDFAGACQNGDFQAVGADVSYFNLDLDLFNGFGGEAKDCVITTKIPARSGLRINVSDFQAEAFAQITADRGLASLLVNHRFNGQIVGSNRDVATDSRDMLAEQTAVALSKCGEKVQLQTRISTRAKDAVLFLDNTKSNTVSYKIKYIKC
ncbi:MAG: hypothetical protein ACOH5I_18060 [Oligoflexus sp.]